MDIKTEDLIISEYKKGKSSLQIVKIIGLSKSTILKVLHKHNLVRKRDRCSKLKIEEKDNFFYTRRICPKCGQPIITKSKDKVICCRNHYKKVSEGTLCKPCSLDLQKGEGNPFYGKKHNKSTIKKISKARKGKGIGEKNAMSKKENRDKVREKFLNRIKKSPIKYSSRSKDEIKIYDELKKIYKKTTHTFIMKPYIYDVFVPELNLIIEYNGDYWHCNPNKYTSEYYHKHKNKTAKEIWMYDKNKIDLLIEKGYYLEIVWESDFKSNPNLIKNLIKKYVKNKSVSHTE